MLKEKEAELKLEKANFKKDKKVESEFITLNNNEIDLETSKHEILQNQKPELEISLNSITPSMVSNWITVNYIPKQAPSSITSMVSHCAKLPSPGDRFLSMEEVLEEMRVIFKNFWKT